MGIKGMGLAMLEKAGNRRQGILCRPLNCGMSQTFHLVTSPSFIENFQKLVLHASVACIVWDCGYGTLK